MHRQKFNNKKNSNGLLNLFFAWGIYMIEQEKIAQLKHNLECCVQS